MAVDSAVHDIHDHRLSSTLSDTDEIFGVEKQLPAILCMWQPTSRYICSFFKQRKKIVIDVGLDVFFVQLGKEIGNKLRASGFFLPVE